jgi:hypothetical protein
MPKILGTNVAQSAITRIEQQIRAVRLDEAVAAFGPADMRVELVGEQVSRQRAETSISPDARNRTIQRCTARDTQGRRRRPEGEHHHIGPGVVLPL